MRGVGLVNRISAALFEPALRRSERNGLAVRRGGLLACGCRLDRTPEAIAVAGFTVEEVRCERCPEAAMVLQPLAVGSATR